MGSQRGVLRDEVLAAGWRPGTAGPVNRSKNSFRPDFPARQPALCERRPRHFSSPFNSWEGHASLPSDEKKKGRTDAPLARRPVRSGAATNARVRSKRASLRRQAIDRSPVVLPPISDSTSRFQQSPLCASAFLCVGGSGSIWVICGQISVLSVSLWFFCQ